MSRLLRRAFWRGFGWGFAWAVLLAALVILAIPVDAQCVNDACGGHPCLSSANCADFCVCVADVGEVGRCVSGRR